MSESNPTPKRTYEGPARLISDRHDERMLREEGRGVPKSFARQLTETYGPEGTGWGFETDTTHAQANEMRQAFESAEFTLATEALRNSLNGRGYILDDGTNVAGKVQRYVRTPDMGNVVVYPDGDVHRTQKETETTRE